VPLTDALTGAAVAPGTAVHLGAWDVRVFASAGTEAIPLGSFIGLGLRLPSCH